MTSRPSCRARLSAAVAVTRTVVAVSAALCAVLITSDCSGSPSGPGPKSDEEPVAAAPPPPTPELVKTVEIVPAIIHATAGSLFEVVAIARTADGVPLVNPGPVAWTGASFSDPSALRTVVTLPAAGPITLTATIASKPATATVIIAPGTPNEDNVALPHVAAGPVEAVLIDANQRETSAFSASPTLTCRDDLLYRVAGLAVLGRNLTIGCSNSLAVFAVGHAVRFECQQNVTTPNLNCTTNIKNLWSDNVDPVSRTTLPPPLNVDLVVWLRANVTDDEGNLEATTDANYATDIYEKRRAGMVFSIRTDAGGSGGFSGAFDATDADAQCTGAETQLGFNPVSAAINVVYVDEILYGEDASVRGIMCDRENSAAPILIVSWKRKVPSTLAHEIAHLMGLMSRILNADWRGGHTTFLSTFDETNLMWAQENAAVGLERDHLSLGQVFRLHADERSWINVPGSRAAGLSIRMGDKQVCQAERHTSTPCPQLHQDLRTP